MATKANIFLDKGSDFTTTIDVVNSANAAVNMAAYTVTSTIKASYTNAQVNSTSTSNLSFTADGYSNGSVILSLTDTQTGYLQDNKRYIYDVKVVTGTTTTKLIEGVLQSNPSTT
jgi:hypothetical protein|tara:strand:- start:64 stop:408 length:345 start_codon:yes stop_codon:yes gene_type:complete